MHILSDKGLTAKATTLASRLEVAIYQKKKLDLPSRLDGRRGPRADQTLMVKSYLIGTPLVFVVRKPI